MSKQQEIGQMAKAAAENPLRPIVQRELADIAAYNQLFDESFGGRAPGWLNQAKPAYRSGMSFVEESSDQLTEAGARLNRQFAAFDHARELEQQAGRSISRGHLAAAEHLLRRNLKFSVQALGIDADRTARSAAEVKTIDAFLDLPALRF